MSTKRGNNLVLAIAPNQKSLSNMAINGIKMYDIPLINLPRKMMEEYWFLAPMLRLAISLASLNIFF